MPRRPSTHVDSPAGVGERLRAARLAAGLSQRDLSFDGCTAAYVSRIEAGARTPSYQILREFGKRLGVTADYLATGEDALAPDAFGEAELTLRLGDAGGAAEIYERELRDSRDERTTARAEAGLGRVALERGDAREAAELLSRAVSGDALPAQEAIAAADALARAHCALGQFEEAFAVLQRFLERAKELGDRFETMRFSLLLAVAYTESGKLRLAESVLADALADAKEIADPLSRAGLYWSESRRYRAAGRADLAADYAQLAATTLRSTEHAATAARAMLLKATFENDRGDGAAALVLLDDAECSLADTEDPLPETTAAIERARALALVGEEAKAVSLMREVVTSLGDADARTSSIAFASAASFFRARGDSARALELYGLAAAAAPAPSRHTAQVLTAMAEIHEEQGDADEALRLLKAALGAGDRVAVG